MESLWSWRPYDPCPRISDISQREAWSLYDHGDHIIHVLEYLTFLFVRRGKTHTELEKERLFLSSPQTSNVWALRPDINALTFFCNIVCHSSFWWGIEYQGAEIFSMLTPFLLDHFIPREHHDPSICFVVTICLDASNASCNPLRWHSSNRVDKVHCLE